MNDSQPADTAVLDSLEVIDALASRFEFAWRDGQQPEIAEYLREVDPPLRGELFAELLKCELELRSGEAPPSSLQQYLPRFPEYRDILEQLLSAPAASHGTSRIFGEQTVAHSPRRALQVDAELPCRFGEYELLHKLGDGGMGVVFQARHLPANRIVALKMIRSDLLSRFVPDQRAQLLARFQTEIKAAAGLEHEHIVPVYDVGEVDGQPYYTMRYVDGKSLRQRVADGPIDPREAAGLMAGVTRAVDAAHRHQPPILHRDIKPHNILIDRESHRAMLTDFGLAKISQADQDLTATGILGSPPYMSPEQTIDPKNVTPAADVYSLGATLYHLLVGRPPFLADTLPETVRQINQNEPVAPRELNPRIDRDLETICLKCLQKEPAVRYAAAADLAADLDLYLQGRAIGARPIGRATRAWRWCRRNPTVAGLTAGMLALLLIFAVGGPIAAIQQGRLVNEKQDLLDDNAGLISQLNDSITDLDQANSEKAGLIVELRQQKDLALQEKQRAEDHFQEVLDTVDQLLARVGVEKLGNVPMMQRVRRDLLRDALAAYQSLLPEYSQNEKLRRRMADAYASLGAVNTGLGLTDESIEAWNSARDYFTQLSQDYPDKVEYRFGKARCLSGLVSVSQWQQDYAAAKEQSDQAIAEMEAALASIPEQNQSRKEYAEHRDHLVRGYFLRGILLSMMEENQAAFEAFEQGARHGEALVADFPEVSGYRWSLANCYSDHGGVLWKLAMKSGDRSGRPNQQQLEEAEVLMRRGLDLRESTDAGDSIYRDSLASSYANLAQLLIAKREFEAAYQALQSALQLHGKNVEQFPNKPLHWAQLGSDYGVLADLHLAAGNLDEALHAIDIAISHQTKAVDAVPGHKYYTLRLWNHYAVRGRTLSAMAQAARRDRARIYVRAADAFAHEAYIKLKNPSMAQGDIDEWIQPALDNARLRIRRAIAAIESPVDYHSVTSFLVSTSVLELRDPQRAIEIAEAGIKRATHPGHRAMLRRTIGVAHYRAGDLDPAIDILLEMKESGDADDPLTWLFLAMAYARNEQGELAVPLYEQAIAALSGKPDQQQAYGPFLREASRLIEGNAAAKDAGSEAGQSQP